MGVKLTIKPKQRHSSSPTGVRAEAPESNHLSADDIKEDMTRRYRRRSQKGLDPDRLEDARQMSWFKKRNGT